MGQRGRPRAKVILTDSERAELERLARRSRINRNLAFRARLILSSAEGLADTAVAERVRTSSHTVGKWRRRFLKERMDGLFDEPRVGAPRKITDEQVEEIVVRTLEETPKGRTHWSTRKMARAAGVSPDTVGRIWRAFGLKPHVVRGFKLSNDPQFIEKVRDVVGLYMSPPANAVVFCFDEKSGVQALERAQPILPMDIGRPERRTHNYIRHGRLDLFAALNVATGEVFARTKRRHRAIDVVHFFKELDAQVPKGLEIHVILDNLSTHKSAVVQAFLQKNGRFVLHFTPTYSSWLNLVERFFALLTDEALRRGSHTSIPQLRQAIMNYVEAHNEEAGPFKWTKTADEVLESARSAGERTLQLHGPGTAKELCKKSI